jgi:hypothetical protein
MELEGCMSDYTQGTYTFRRTDVAVLLAPELHRYVVRDVAYGARGALGTACSEFAQKTPIFSERAAENPIPLVRCAPGVRPTARSSVTSCGLCCRSQSLMFSWRMTCKGGPPTLTFSGRTITSRGLHV